MNIDRIFRVWMDNITQFRNKSNDVRRCILTVTLLLLLSVMATSVGGEEGERSDENIIAELEVEGYEDGKVYYLEYEDSDSTRLSIAISGHGTLTATRIEDDTDEVGDDPNGYFRISFYLKLTFEGMLNWTNITISYAGIPEDISQDYSEAQIFYYDDFGDSWQRASLTGMIEEQKLVWANLTHFTIFAAFSLDIIPPTAEAGNNISIGQRENVVFNGSGSDDNLGIVEYLWMFQYDGMTVSLNGMNTNHTFAHVGIYTIMLKVTDAAGYYGTDNLTVTVKDITPPTAIFNLENEVNQGTEVILTASNCSDNVGIVKYSWSFEYNGSPYELINSTSRFIFDIVGEYNIVLTVMDLEGNSGSVSNNLTVLDTEAPIANFAYNKPSIKVGDTVRFDSAGSTDNVKIETQTWMISGPDGTKDYSGSIIEHTFIQEGTYTVILSVEDGRGNEDSDTKIIVIRLNDEKKNGGNRLSLLMIIGVVIAVGIIIIVLFIILRKRPMKEENELQILKKRLAKGEITKEEFEELRMMMKK